MTSLFLSILWLSWTISGTGMPPYNLAHSDRPIEAIQNTVNERVRVTGTIDFKNGSEITSRQIYLMGTLCTLHYVSDNPEQSVDRMESMVRILEETEGELSTWKDSSIISRLNRQPVGAPLELEPSMIELFLELQHWSRETKQSFDPTVGKLLEAYALKKDGRWPTAASIENARQNTGMQHYKLDKNGPWITRMRDIRMDAGSFGKGEALDRLMKVHDENDSWMADLGGQILVHGSPPGKTGWPAAIAHPLKRNEAFLSVFLRAGSLATSGGSERDIKVGNRRIGHILDSRTGKPAPFNGSVSVWHKRALTADILSTALYVMGPEKGLRWADDRNIAACFLVPHVEGNVEIIASWAFREIVPAYSFTNFNPDSVLRQAR